MTRLRIPVTAALLLVMVGLPHAAAGQAGLPAAAEVRARDVAFATTLADRDFDAFLTFLSPDAIFFAADGPLRGRDAVARVWAGYFEGPEAPFAWRPDVAEVLESGDLALTSGVVLVDGEQTGRYVTVWRREADGQWRVVFDRAS